MIAKISDVISLMERLAPLNLAEQWDNAGLQVGQRDWPVRKILVALDPAVDVVAEACKNNVDLLITHHPLIFKPLKSIDFNTPIG
ncbi:MAG: Nif3-like dinuclear metal center hexameric protein, partial [Deltaproteobacteria bacterium]|nr:Nif3-like dinuclear metal center hexameric protein [Deltaproteobacteria bacterium]